MASTVIKLRSTITMVCLLLTSCYYDNEAVLYPNSVNCTDNPNPTFTTDILPILDARCNTCHSSTSPSADIRLDTYNEVVKYVNNGSLMGSINHSSAYSAMPKNSSKLSACQINKIQTWINSGGFNN